MKPISVGDLVCFSRSCCDKYRDGVYMFVVGAIHRPFPLGTACTYCHTPIGSAMYAVDDPRYPGAPLAWLKRIPPPDELGLEQEKIGEAA